MISIKEAAIKAETYFPDLEIASAASYRNYYIFSLQMPGASVGSKDYLMDNYVIINANTGDRVHRSLYSFPNIFAEAKEIQPSEYQ